MNTISSGFAVKSGEKSVNKLWTTFRSPQGTVKKRNIMLDMTI
jgi:hypothetical protein